VRHLIVGTAGHIDHGKSALVRALTGTDPDRLPEEKARGITIDLGFADLDLGSGRFASFVDVPGHERFVRHMVAGATGIDCVLLAIACDDGVRPQTREHLAICSLLGIRHGIVALTKIDLLEPELRQVAELEVREFLDGTFLSAAPVVPVSARTGEGLPDLRAQLLCAFDRVPERAAGGVARLPVDRSFVLHGFGTVVTGTLASGTFAEGDEVEVLPGGKRGRIRGLQVHRQRVASVRAGQRSAVNVQGLARDEIPRGATLCRPGTIPVTRRVWARVRLLPTAPERLRRGGPVRFHQGTAERAARLRFLEPDASDLAEITLRGETVVLPGDPFILRRPAPVDTVGGGTVEDVRPPARKARAAAAPRSAGRDADFHLLECLARARAGGAEASVLAAELGLAAGELDAHLDRLEAAGTVTRAGGRAVLAEALETLREAVTRDLEEFHRAQPLDAGRSREELRTRVGRDVPQEVWRAFLERMAALGHLRLERDRVALRGHEVKLSGPELAARNRLEALFRDAGLDPPDPDEAARSEGLALGRKLLKQLEAEGVLARIRDGRYFHAEALASLRAKLRRHARAQRTIDVATFKEIAGVTRKNAIPLLEQLDAERFTRRAGNLREILAPADPD